MANWSPGAVKQGTGWTDLEMERVVIAIIERELGVDMDDHTLDSSFIEEMGAD